MSPIHTPSLLAAALLCVSTSAAQDLIGIAPDGVFTIDRDTGATGVSISQFYLDGASDSADPDVIYTRLDALDLLARVDLVTGNVEALGTMTLPPRDIAHDHARGVLYGTDGLSLQVIAVPSGATTVVGTLTASGGPWAPSPSGVLALGYDNGRDRLLGTDGLHLWEIDPATAACTWVGAHGVPGIQDIHVDAATDRIFAVTAPQSELYELDPDTAWATRIAPLLDGPFTGLASAGSRTAGTSYCVAAPNSTGTAAITEVFSPGVVSSQHLLVATRDLPPGRPCLMLASLAPGWIGGFLGSEGNLCLLGNVATFTSQLGWAGPDGRVLQDLDLTAFPTRPLPTAVQPGDQWHFQAWYRDEGRSGPTTNFSQPVALLMQ